MISNYLYTIGKYLSPSQRDEVLKEIEANLYDYLEESFGEKDYSNDEIEKAIKSMGHPRKVAEAYMNSPRSLIGPAYIDTYWLVLKIALFGTAIGLTVSNIISLSDAKDIIQHFIKLVVEIIQSSLSAFGLITVIFIALQHYIPQDYSSQEEEWSISTLDKAPEANEKVKIIEVIVESFFLFLALVLLNQPTIQLGVSLSNTVVIPMVNMTYFSPFLIWLNIIFGISLILNFYLLIMRKWQGFTRIIAILLNVIWIVLLAKIISTPEIWDFTIISGMPNIDSGAIQGIQIGVYIGLAVFVIIAAFDSFGHLKALIKKKTA